MDDKPNTIGERISLLRQRYGMTYEQIGDLAGVGKSAVRKWELGITQNMRLSSVSAVAKALHTTPGYLLGWVDDPDDPGASSTKATRIDDDSPPGTGELVSIARRLHPNSIQRLIGYAQALLDNQPDS